MSKIVTVKIDPCKPEKDVIARAAAIIQKGGLVVAPTETRYGLLARVDREEALNKLSRVKNRPVSVPVAVFVRSIEDIPRYGRLTALARALASAFLPGPLTLVLEAVPGWASPLVVEGKIGIRYSSSPVIQALVDAADLSLTATSANKYEQPEHETVAEIAVSLGEEVDLYLDAGVLDKLTSTVVDCTGGEPRLIREGYILKEKIEEVLNKQVGHE